VQPEPVTAAKSVGEAMGVLRATALRQIGRTGLDLI
jgi:hypothetical protein